MTFQHLIKPFVTAAIIAACIILGVVNFGEGRKFDSLIIIFFIVAAYFFRNNNDALGTLVIIVVSRICEELVYYNFENTWFFKVPIYVFCGFALYKIRNDKYWLLACALTAVTFGFELFWSLISYPAPEVYYYVYIAAISLLVRWFLVFRPFLMERWFSADSSITRMDWTLYQIHGWFIAFQFLMVAEYLLRHHTEYSYTLIHTLYTPLNQGLSVYILYCLLNHVRQEREEQVLKI